MTMRQLIIAVIIGSGIIALLLAGALGVVYYKPELIGLKDPSDTTKVEEPPPPPPPPPEPLRFVHIEPTVEISRQQLAFFENEVIIKDELKIKKDSLLNLEKFLRDSLKVEFQKIKDCKDSVKRQFINYDNLLKEKNLLADSVGKVEQELSGVTSRLETARKRIENYEEMLESRIDSASRMNFETFAKIYDNSNPADVARILEQLDERDAARILKLMQRRNAGKVLEAMRPENAAAILLLGVGQ